MRVWKVYGFLAASFVFLCACGGTESKTSKKNNQDEKKAQGNSDSEYFKLTDTCQFEQGFTIVEDKCLPAKISLDLDGTVTIGSDFSPNSFLIKAVLSQNVQTSMRVKESATKRSETYLEYHLEKRSENKRNFGLNVSTVVDKNRTIKRVNVDNFYGQENKSDILLSLFERDISVQEQKRDKISLLCDEITNLFFKNYPDRIETSTVINASAFGNICGVINKNGLDEEGFHSFRVAWNCADDQCHFEELSVN